MLKPNSYQHICHTFDEIPEQMFTRLRREIGEKIGQPVSAIFPAFAQAFPLTVTALEEYWPKPFIACSQFMQRWSCNLLIERNDLNLYFDLTIIEDPLEGEDFEREHAMFPPAWKELYRFFYSFVVTDKSIKPLSWINTPSGFTGRPTLEEYRQQLGMGKSKARDFANAIGSDQLMCWLRTDAGDALFLDEKHCDHKVYHVRGAALEDVYVLPDPAGTLDCYLAHYLSGKSPAQFDFRGIFGDTH